MSESPKCFKVSVKMSKVQILRASVNQRLSTAVEEIFELFERTIAEYEEELCRSKEENERNRKLLDAVFSPEVRLHRADVQLRLVSKEEVLPEQQEGSPPEPPHIKEEQEDPWTSQEREQLGGLEDTKFTFTPVPLKNEEDGEKPQSSQLHQSQTEEMETEFEGEDCRGSKPGKNSDPEDSSEPETDDSDDWEETTERQSGLNSLKKSKVKRRNTKKKPFSCSECGKQFYNKSNIMEHMRTHTGEKPFSCSVCGKRFAQGKGLRRHMSVHTGEKAFGCPECDKTFSCKTHLKKHMSIHKEGKRYNCSKRDQRFTRCEQLKKHSCVGRQSPRHRDNQPEDGQAGPPVSSSAVQMEKKADGEDCERAEPVRNSDPDRHSQSDTDKKTGEPEPDKSEETKEPQSELKTLKKNKVKKCKTDKKSFSCPECGKRFNQKSHLTIHMRDHTGEQPFSCCVCARNFGYKSVLLIHMRTHTGERPFSCSQCGKKFGHKSVLKRHMITHTVEKPFSCSECGKVFGYKSHLKAHMRTHTGEEPLRCPECGKRFGHKTYLKKHMLTHTEKPFGCSLCGKRFGHKTYLMQHKFEECGKELSQTEDK